ncbi:hypothetical protein NQZ68_023300, partial [Dissostichus eleginoides]
DGSGRKQTHHMSAGWGTTEFASGLLSRARTIRCLNVSDSKQLSYTEGRPLCLDRALTVIYYILRRASLALLVGIMTLNSSAGRSLVASDWLQNTEMPESEDLRDVGGDYIKTMCDRDIGTATGLRGESRNYYSICSFSTTDSAMDLSIQHSVGGIINSVLNPEVSRVPRCQVQRNTTPQDLLQFAVTADEDSASDSPVERKLCGEPCSSFGLLLGVFLFCGLALLGLLTFVSWKLCRVPLRTKAHLSSPSLTLTCDPEICPLQPTILLPSPLQSPVTMATEKVKDPMGSMGFLEAAVKISHTSPDIPAEVQLSMREHFLRRTTRMQRQATEPASSTRHNSFKRHLPRQMQVGSLDLGYDYTPDNDDRPTSIGRIQPELYQQKTLESEDSSKNGSSKNCGRINFSLKYDYENEALIVNIIKASDLPAKDLCGTSDPYVKVYLLPDRKKFQTRVHRKMLNPIFNESFQFPVPYDELAIRKLHMSVFDFDRFSRHDMIGEVELDNLFETSDLSRETNIWRDIQYASTIQYRMTDSIETFISNVSLIDW